ncbi:MAG: hypothetical protein GY790_03025 [Bacteroidetes bacterium]|nr:hypothetical protein [Bacteroidota bacterium]
MLRSRVDSYDPRQTDGAKERKEELLGEWNRLNLGMERIIRENIEGFNELYEEEKLPALIIL